MEEVMMLKMRVAMCAGLVAAALVVAAVVPTAAQGEKPKTYRFTAIAMNLGAGPNAGTVDFAIERLSSDQERTALLSAFFQNGGDALLSALQKVKPRVGYIRLPQTLAYDLQYAYRTVNPDGSSRIVIATDRRIGYQEVRNNARTMDYPFTLIEMHLDAKGNGEGRLAVAVKIARSKDGKTLELENFGQAPVALTRIELNK
jgi:hypothetical protein